MIGYFSKKAEIFNLTIIVNFFALNCQFSA